MGERITQVGKFVRWCENHKSASIVVIIGIIIISLGNFTDALEKICSFFKTNPPKEITAKWQPPALPEGCKKVFIFLGGQSVEMDASMLSKSKGAGSLSEFTMILPEGMKADYPLFPYIRNNRLFVKVRTPFETNRVAIYMNDNLDSQLPDRWDRNFNTNAFEIVDEDKLPVLQVFYKRANEIQVNGIFFVKTNIAVVAFGERPFQIFYSNFAIASNYSEIINFPDRKALFKYPSWQNLGEYSN